MPITRKRVESKVPGRDFVVETKKKRGPKQALEPLPAETLQQIIGPLAEKVPSSQPIRYGEILSVEQKSLIPATRQEYAREINRLFAESQRNFMKIGKLLDLAEQTLPPEDYRDLWESLPFERSVRSQIRTAYRAVQEGIVPEAIAEHSGYSTVYQASKLTQEQRQQAIEEGVIRPDTTREEIIAFRKRFNEPDTDDLNRLLKKRERLQTKVTHLQAEIAAISEKISLYQSLL